MNSIEKDTQKSHPILRQLAGGKSPIFIIPRIPRIPRKQCFNIIFQVKKTRFTSSLLPRKDPKQYTTQAGMYFRLCTIHQQCTADSRSKDMPFVAFS